MKDTEVKRCLVLCAVCVSVMLLKDKHLAVGPEHPTHVNPRPQLLSQSVVYWILPVSALPLIAPNLLFLHGSLSTYKICQFERDCVCLRLSDCDCGEQAPECVI